MTEKTPYLTLAALALQLELPKEALMLAFQACNIFKRNFDSFVTPEEVVQIQSYLEARKASRQIQETREGQTKRRLKFQIAAGAGGKGGTIQVEVRKKRRVPSTEAPALPIEAEATAEALRPSPSVEQGQPMAEVLQPEAAPVETSAPTSDAKAEAYGEEPFSPSEFSEALVTEPPLQEKTLSADHPRLGLKRPTHLPKSAPKAAPKAKRGGGNKSFQIQSLDELEEGDAGLASAPRRSRPTANRGTRKPQGGGGIKRQPASDLKQRFQVPTQAITKEIKVHEGLTLAEFAEKLAVKASWVIRELLKLGLKAGLNEVVDFDAMQLIASSLGHQLSWASGANLEADWLRVLEENQKDLRQDWRPRPPVVTVMGHVDHGKTSLLDRLRKTCVASQEAGGITQQIGATVAQVLGREVVFIDTPGHAMFNAMRARGAQVTDIAIVVVAIDDGIKPQTIEAIQHAKSAVIPIIIAVTKVDKVAEASRDLQPIQEALLSHEVVVEAWGGDTQIVAVSSKTGEGLQNLMEAVLLQADCLDLKANYAGLFEGIVIESKIEKGMGPCATILAQSGILRRGDRILCGSICARIRLLRDAQGRSLQQATPPMPVAVYGLPDCPLPGDRMYSLSDDKLARELAEQRKAGLRQQKQTDLLAKERIDAWKTSGLNSEGPQADVLIELVLKADTYGSLEALQSAIEALNGYEGFKIRIRGSGVGGLTEGDVVLAASSQALLMGFNVRPDVEARLAMERLGVVPQYHQVIYAALDGLKATILSRLAPLREEVFKGAAEVRATFRSPKFGLIAGCYVVEGVMSRKAPVRVLRKQAVICASELDSIRRGKDDVQEVKQGNECGIGIKQYADVQIGDRIEAYEIKIIPRNPFEHASKG